ncbi:hypothetical protein LOD99_9681 [Oopsacas minuta]|uniref:Large ribosomal subunit protein uL29 n=1 Tax=Oopsacas minuta TaxID=111878 RepID=A0AAV7KKZ7_9METZ|nr:hypothetical protein LOD99_9681 [Oopsacas minuta]
MSKTKAKDLREVKNRKDLLNQLDELKKELITLKVSKATGSTGSKPAKIKIIRRSIARILTVLNAKERQELKKYYSKKKYKPLDMRPKLTRAIRRQLSKSEKKKKTLRQVKKERHFPMRKFAIKTK